MVCKEEIVVWFKDISSYKRIDVMCTLLNMCVPFELRFLGTCLEDLGKRDFHILRESEDKANSYSEHSDLQCLSDKRTRSVLAIYISLLHSCNRLCADGFYKVLSSLDSTEICSIINNSSSEENPLEGLLLLYTMALNHPAFTFEQKSLLASVFYKLQEEENRLYAAKAPPPSLNFVYIKPALQSYVPCLTTEERSQQDMSVLGPCPTMALPPNQPAEIGKGRGSVPTPIAAPTGLALTPDQIPTNYVPVFSPPGQPVAWPSTVTPLMMCPSLPVEGPAYPTSPPPSQHSSPSESGSPSRSNSPIRGPPSLHQGSLKAVSTNKRPEGNKQNCIDKPGSLCGTLPAKSSMELVDPFKETLGKEMPTFQQNLQNYTFDELKRMSDEELKDIGLPPSAIHQLRAIVTKLNSTNGLTILDKQDPPPSRRKPESNDAEQTADGQSTMVRRFVPSEPGLPIMYSVQQPRITCYTLPMPSAQSGRQVYCMNQMNNTFRNLKIDLEKNRNNSNSSSASESSSASHSPPDTPLTTQWENKGYTFIKDANLRERCSPTNEEKSDKDNRVPEPSERLSGDTSRSRHSNVLNHKPRNNFGIGRGMKTNPPGLQTIARGRGPDGSHKSLSGGRSSVNGAQPRQGPTLLHQSSSEMMHVNQYPSVSNSTQAQPRPADGTISYTHSSPFAPHYPNIRTNASIYQSCPPGTTFVRPIFPFSPNGELVYQYHAHQTHTPPPPPPSYMPPIASGYSAPVNPPKMSCYNCGSHNHYAIDCKEPTMEEVTKPGTYRIDYSQYPKAGDCATEK